jgi:hypothetical protein
MKKIMILCFSLLLVGSALAERSNESVKLDDSLQAFWKEFKGAVAKGDKEAVARMSKFPIGMSYAKASIKNSTQLRRRYREVFNEQTNAAVCFSKAQPEVDAQNPKLFTVACPDAGGNEVVLYHFEQTKTGWKFTALDNINE